MPIAVACCAGTVMCLALYGWGRSVRRLAAIQDGAWPVTIALGLACLIFLGGALNLARLAYPGMLDALVAAGLGLAALGPGNSGIREALRVGWPAKKDERPPRLAWYGLMALLAGYLLATQLKPAVYNYNDDFQKYFAHAARMVQTGTLFGSPLNSLGYETLGAQAFLQGFIVGHFPIAYINAFDAVFCLLLTALLAGGVGMGRTTVAPLAAAGVLAAVLINPQYVNISAVYSGAALISALILLSSDAREYAGAAAGPSPAATGLVYAALAALKLTFALFACLHWLFCAIAAASAAKEPRAELRRSLASALWSLGFLLPWIALHAPHYLAGLLHGAPALKDLPPSARETVNLLSAKALFYGASYAQYTFLAAAVFACGAAMMSVPRLRADPAAARLAGACVATASCYLAMILWLGPRLFGYETALRYAIPLLIGTVAPLLSLGPLSASAAGAGKAARARLFAALLAALVVGGFLPDAYRRARAAELSGSMLAYLPAWTPAQIQDARAFDEEVLSAGARRQWAGLQQRVPAGEPLLAWNCAPFLLDFRRNPIIDVNAGGLDAPWSTAPALSYALWQYRGYSILGPGVYAAEIGAPGLQRSFLGARMLKFWVSLEALASRSQILFNDGATALFRVTGGPAAQGL